MDERKEYQIPQTIGPYTIESLYRVGGMSRIYLGKDPKNNQTVAIKVVIPKYLKSRSVLSRVMREAKVLGISDHPNIVKLLGLGQFEDSVYIAMEFIQGVSLREFIKEKSFTHKKALEIILQVSYGLAHLHALGVVHRDIKPDNILITESGDVKLVDFGISQFLSAPNMEFITKKNSRLGTPMYMSPEQKENIEKVSFVSDIFSLAMVCYELYIGKLCFGVVDLTHLPVNFKAIMKKALAVNPEHRYQDIIDFITDISAFLKSFENQESFEEIDFIQEARRMLINKSFRKFPGLDIAIAVYEAAPFYLDACMIEQNRFFMWMAEPCQKGIEGILASMMLRGMMKAIDLKKLSFSQVLQTLNDHLYFDQLQFHFSLLLVDLSEKNLQFVSCQHGSLLRTKMGVSISNTLDSQSPLIGSQLSPNFLIMQESFSQEDTLLISSMRIPEKLSIKAPLAPKPFADATLKELLNHFDKYRTKVIVALEYI